MGSIQWNDVVLGRIIGKAPEVVAEVERATDAIAGKANAMSSSYRTGYYHPDSKSPGVGRTQPKYVSDIQVMDNAVVGIVHTGNYAAMKDNYENNTLLKARG